MKYLLLSAAPALLAFAYWYAIYPPYFCSGMCCVVKSKCASVPMKENIVQPKYEQVASALAESLKVGWDLGASVFMVRVVLLAA